MSRLMDSRIGNNNLLNSYNNYQHTMYNPNINNAFSNNPLLRRLDDQRSHIMGRTNEIREINEVKKLQKVNTSDKRQMEMLRDVLINPVKIEKNNVDMKRTHDIAESQRHLDVEILWKDEKNIKNTPYKIIIPQKTKTTPHGFDYNQKIKEPKQLVIHTVTKKDKDKKVFENNLNSLENKMNNINTENKIIYSDDKKAEHKSKFEYEHVFYKKTVTDVKRHDELKNDQESYAKLKSREHEDGKNTRDAILASLQNDNDVEVKDDVKNEVHIDNLDSFIDSVIDKKTNIDSLIDDVCNKPMKKDDINDLLEDLLNPKQSSEDELNKLLRETGLL